MQNWKTYAAAILGLAITLNHIFHWVPSEVEGAVLVAAATLFGIQVQSQMQGQQQSVSNLHASVTELHAATQAHMQLSKAMNTKLTAPKSTF